MDVHDLKKLSLSGRNFSLKEMETRAELFLSKATGFLVRKELLSERDGNLNLKQ